jgi:hypothetical protein
MAKHMLKYLDALVLTAKSEINKNTDSLSGQGEAGRQALANPGQKRQIANMDASFSFHERFSKYFDREVAEKAARPLSDGVEIEFRVAEEIFTFTRESGRNQIKTGPAKDPQLLFSLTPAAAESILTDPSDEIGTIGVNILKLMVAPDDTRKVSIWFKAGFLTLFSKGYLGVLATGGSQFAAFLASRGLTGLGAIKAAINKLKSAATTGKEA